MVITRLKRLLVGTPLASQMERHERLAIPIALSVFASDALSSTAYATEEILLALTASIYAAQANLLSLPVAGAIILLMIIVIMSYWQLVKVFNDGGGTYQVSKERIGPLASQIAGAALLIDYVLTVAVSISAGVTALVSTGLVSDHYRVLLAVFFTLLLMVINLRGVKESGRVLAIPVYFFIISMVVMVAIGFWRVLNGDVSPLAPESIALLEKDVSHWTNMGLVLVLLKAFSHGCAALTGIEAISNGVQAFKEPAADNANKTLVLMGIILGTIFIGVTFLAFQFGIVPDEVAHRSVISMVASSVLGYQSIPYYLFQAATMIILVLAANTSFSGFPRLGNILANDGFLPRQLMNLGDRLVFSNGIVILGVLSILLTIMYHADTHSLIPLYAVGVFLSFTLAQLGMVIHHWQERESGWRWRMVINGFGAITTAVVTVILTLEKFMEGAWIVLLAIPLLIILFRSVHHHYRTIARQLALPAEKPVLKENIEHTVLVLVSSLNRGTIPALQYAKSLSKNVEAVHIELNPAATQRLKKAWDEWGSGIALTILKSPYRSLSQPLLDYVDEVEQRHEHDIVTVIIPEFITKKWWHNLLHNQTSLLLKTLLRFRKGKVVTTYRYYLEE